MSGGNGQADVPTKPSMPAVDRRKVNRLTTRPVEAPDPELIREATSVLEFYGGDPGALGDDCVRRVIVAIRAWDERKAAEERRHERLRDGLLRVQQLEIHNRVKAHIVPGFACGPCDGEAGHECGDCGGTGVVS